MDGELAVLATNPVSNQVTLSAGAAQVRGKWYYNSADELITIAANGSGNPRIDLVILQSDYVAQEVRFAVLQGTPAVSPSIPTLTQNEGVLWEIPIARVAVASGFTTIAQTDITDMRSWCNLPDALGVQVSNESATVLEKGAVVIHDTAPEGVPMAVNTTTTAGNRLLAGVIESRVSAAGGITRVITHGITPVIVDETVVAGDKLTTSTTAGQAGILEAGRTCLPFAWALTGAGAGETALCYVHVQVDSRPLYPTGFKAFRNADQTVSANVTTKIDWNAEDWDDGGYFDLTTNEFQPLESGRWLVGVSASGQNTANNFLEIQDGLGNTLQRQFGNTSGFGGWSIVTELEFNGTTDLIAAYININDTNVDLATRIGQFWAYKISELA